MRKVHTARLAGLALLCALLASASSVGSAQAAAPTVGEQSALNVTATSATLEAAIDPHGAPTSFYFQYGTTASYGSTVPAPPGTDIGAGEGNQSVAVHLQGLAASAIYHYRIVAVGESGTVTVDGPDQTFATQAAGGEFTLPDGRSWEMVTPPSKQGAGIRGVGFEEGAEIQAAANGDGITYAATASFEVNPAGNRAFESAQVFSKRQTPGAWETHDITTAHYEGATFVPAGNTSEYKFFSSDLSLGLVEPVGHTPLPPLPAGSEKTMYLRNAAGEFQALVTPENVPPGTVYGGNGEAVGGVEFAFGTPDLSSVVVSSQVALIKGDGPGLYEWRDGQFLPVSVLPNKEFVSGGAPQEENTRDSISNDGSHVVFQHSNDLYLRDMARGETVQIDAPAEKLLAGPSRFMVADSEETRMFFTSIGQLTAGAQSGDLYAYEATSAPSEPLAGKLTDLTVDGNAGESAEVQSVIGSSEDGTDLYFVAKGVLGDAAAHGAKTADNLYFEHYDTTTNAWMAPVFIAELAEADRASWEFDPRRLTARVSPNGRYLAFMSERSLTGYDNRDAASGVLDEEVFLYDADTAHLVCASCNPTGERPAGVFDTENYGSLFDAGGSWRERWVAANIPGWTNIRNGGTHYQSRYLSNSGRLFFDSADTLVPADVNGQIDVYEYEPGEVAGCAGADHGQSASIVYSEVAGGCVGLISSGTAPEESAFLDASETGGDVFFLTQARLAVQDYDTSYDIYDAHECTAAAPCAPAATLTPPPCSTGDACKPAPTPQPAAFGAPSSETFSGAGNIVPEAPRPVVTARAKGSSQKLTKALRACQRKPKRKRAACQKQARKRYGASKSGVRNNQSAGRGR